MSKTGIIFELAAILLGLALLVFPQEGGASVTSDADQRDGYIQSLEEDSEVTEIADIVLVPKPPPTSSVPLSDVIFDRKLKVEFTERYREKFGYTEAEQNQGTPLLYSEQGISQGRSVEAEQMRATKRAYAEYMFRRLAEHHVDLYFRSDPKLKKVWELKERVSNVEVQVSDQFSVQTIYSYSGNFLTVNLKNPYVNSRVRYEMNPSSFGPSEMVETTLSLGREITSSVYMETHYKIRNGVIILVGQKRLTPTMNVNLTGSTDQTDGGPAPREDRLSAGFSYFY